MIRRVLRKIKRTLTRADSKSRPGAQREPVVSIPDEEMAVMRDVYAEASVILEYGSGGSTVLAAGLEGKTVFSVESDREWHLGVAEWFSANPSTANLVLHYADIGPTGAWGTPTDTNSWAKFSGYPLSIWQRDDFKQPDVVLIDGRFRTACFLTIAYLSEKPVTVLWDDYTGRPEYHVVEQIAKPVAIHGRMARFDLKPMTMERQNLPFVVEQFARIR